MNRSWLEQLEREDVARRKAEDAKQSDPEMEQCVIAYCNWRADGGQGSFETFKREWFTKRGLTPVAR